jgi:hypothetical protein
MSPRPCYRHLDRPIVALWGLEPADLLAIFLATAALLVLANVAAALLGGTLVGLGLKTLKAGKPRGYGFALLYRSGLLRWAPESLRPPFLAPPPPMAGERTLRLSAAPGPEDDETSEARFFRGPRRFMR